VTPELVFLFGSSLWRFALKVVTALVMLLLVLALTGLAAVSSVFGWMDDTTEPGEPTEHVVAAVGDIPADYLAAYRAAGEKHEVAWQVIAAIGWEETRHGRYGEVAEGCILGPPIPRFQGTPDYRARGPMQFLVSSWERFGEDGDGDGGSHPCAIGDAPFGTARHLKDAPGTRPIDYARAVYAYNQSDHYVARVLATAHSYGWNNPVAAASAGGDWYRYQGEQSSFDPFGNESSNCGPASVAMAIRWATGLHLPVRSIRTFIGTNGYTTMDQLSDALTHWGVRHSHSIGDTADIRATLARGNIAIVGLDMRVVAAGRDIDGASADPSLRTGSYITTSVRHFIVVKGVTPDGSHFVVHDPNVWGLPPSPRYWYSDGSSKGEDRLYRVDEVEAGMEIFSSYPGGRGVELLGAVTVPVSRPKGGGR
jgi:hypothetical protein